MLWKVLCNKEEFRVQLSIVHTHLTMEYFTVCIRNLITCFYRNPITPTPTRKRVEDIIFILTASISIAGLHYMPAGLQQSLAKHFFLQVISILSILCTTSRTYTLAHVTFLIKRHQLQIGSWGRLYYA